MTSLSGRRGLLILVAFCCAVGGGVAGTYHGRSTRWQLHARGSGATYLRPLSLCELATVDVVALVSLDAKDSVVSTVVEGVQVNAHRIRGTVLEVGKGALRVGQSLQLVLGGVDSDAVGGKVVVFGRFVGGELLVVNQGLFWESASGFGNGEAYAKVPWSLMGSVARGQSRCSDVAFDAIMPTQGPALVGLPVERVEPDGGSDAEQAISDGGG